MTPTFIKSNAAAQLTMAVEVMDEQGTLQIRQIACERPLTVYLNWKEIVTLMTLGARKDYQLVVQLAELSQDERRALSPDDIQLDL